MIRESHKTHFYHLEQQFPTLDTGGLVRKIYHNKATIDIYQPASVVLSCFPLEMRTH